MKKKKNAAKFLHVAMTDINKKEGNTIHYRNAEGGKTRDDSSFRDKPGLTESVCALEQCRDAFI